MPHLGAYPEPSGGSETVAAALGIPPEKVIVRVTLLGVDLVGSQARLCG